MPELDDFVLTSVELPDHPTLATAARKLSMSVDCLDGSYGVVMLDPERGLYAVRVLKSATTRPYSDLKIQPLR